MNMRFIIDEYYHEYWDVAVKQIAELVYIKYNSVEVTENECISKKYGSKWDEGKWVIMRVNIVIWWGGNFV